MTYKEIIEIAKDCMGFCKACPICNEYVKIVCQDPELKE